ncbi:MAG: sulfatase-like hydrolase/transferase [Acidimicrobiales bacterium]
MTAAPISTLGLLDLTVLRNGYGRQIDSFEADLDVAGLDAPFHAVFIRAPVVEAVGAQVTVLAPVDGRPVLCRQGAAMVASFHPELSDDDRIHRMADRGRPRHAGGVGSGRCPRPSRSTDPVPRTSGWPRRRASSSSWTTAGSSGPATSWRKRCPAQARTVSPDPTRWARRSNAPPPTSTTGAGRTGERCTGSAAGVATLAGLGAGLIALRRRPETEDDGTGWRNRCRCRGGSCSASSASAAPVSRRVAAVPIPAPAAAADAGSELTGRNVVMITIPDLHSYPGFMGGAPVPVVTPNLDALAGQSRVFANHHATTVADPGARVTLLWGDDVSAHGLTEPGAGGYDAYGSRGARSIVGRAREAGVRTIGGGAVFPFPHEQRELFDTYLPNEPATVGVEGAELFFDFGPLVDGRDPDAELVAFVRDELRRDSASPFLMMVGLRLPGLPWRVPPEYVDLNPLDAVARPAPRDDAWDGRGPIGRAQLERRLDWFGAGWDALVASAYGRDEVRQAYLAALSHTDVMVGRIVEALDASPHADDTVVVVVGDHGFALGEHRSYRALSLHDITTRTPLVIRADRHRDFSPGRVESVISSACVAPTVLDVLGVARSGLGISLRGDVVTAGLATTHLENSVSLVYGGAEGGRFTAHFVAGGPRDPSCSS